jgi:hypothetical protein
VAADLVALLRVTQVVWADLIVVEEDLGTPEQPNRTLMVDMFLRPLLRMAVVLTIMCRLLQISMLQDQAVALALDVDFLMALPPYLTQRQ